MMSEKKRGNGEPVQKSFSFASFYDWQGRWGIEKRNEKLLFFEKVMIEVFVMKEKKEMGIIKLLIIIN